MDEKRQLLSFLFQNLKLESKNLSIDTCKPFTTLVDYKTSPKDGGGWTRTNEFRRRGIYSPLQLPLCDTPQRMMEPLEPAEAQSRQLSKKIAGSRT